jgi:hypothetical protein
MKVDIAAATLERQEDLQPLREGADGNVEDGEGPSAVAIPKGPRKHDRIMVPATATIH